MTANVDTLVKTLNGVDASRRAGWAQKFAADEKIDELSRLVNILTEQRDDLRRSLSWLFGVSMALGKKTYDGELFEAMREELSDWDVVLDSSDIERGRKCGSIMDTRTGGTRSKQIRQLQGERASRLVQKQRRVVRDKFANEWGFDTYPDMRRFLIDLLGNPKLDPEYDNNLLRTWAQVATNCGYPTEYIADK